MRFARTAAVLVLVCASASAVGANPKEPPTLAATSSRNYVTANAQGQVVVLDRANGKTRPLSPAEAQRLAQGILQLVNQSTDNLVQVRRASGAVSMDLQGHFQDVMLAKKNDDGTISQACVDNPADAAAFFEIDPLLVDAAKSAAVSRASSDAPIQ